MCNRIFKILLSLCNVQMKISFPGLIFTQYKSINVNYYTIIIIHFVLGRKLQKSLLQLNYTVMNNEPMRTSEDSSTLIDLVIASRVELIKKTLTLELGVSDHKLMYSC